MVLDPAELYELAAELPELDRPVLIVAMTGFVDAAGATKLAADHLREDGDPADVVTFDVDQLYDYRARRPAMMFVEDHWEGYETPEIRIQALTDTAGTRFLMLDGPEPDVQWERFVSAVEQLCGQVSPDQTATAGDHDPAR